MKLALVTPSFKPDFERCKLLCQSVDKWVDPSIEHHIIVDKRDLPLFSQLQNHRTRLRTVEEMIPSWIRRLPGASRWWLSLKTIPVRNWILQQLVKLSVAEHVDARGYIFVDSDVCFVRPFSDQQVLQGDTLRLFAVPGAANLPTHRRWHRSAAKLLGLEQRDYFGSTYIGNQITWRRDVLRSLHRRLEAVSGRSWQEAICSTWHFSEYILYGIFAEHILNGFGHYCTDVPLCHISWDYDLKTDSDIERFFSEIKDFHRAVMVSAKQRIDPERYMHLVA